MKKVCAIAVIGLTLSACAIQQTWLPTSGSRADGTVTLSYEMGMFESGKADIATGIAAAAERCAAWGYAGAEPFGGTMSECTSSDPEWGCVRTRVSATYQCLE